MQMNGWSSGKPRYPPALLVHVRVIFTDEGRKGEKYLRRDIERAKVNDTPGKSRHLFPQLVFAHRMWDGYMRN